LFNNLYSKIYQHKKNKFNQPKEVQLLGVLNMDVVQQWEVGNQWNILIEQKINKESQVHVINHNLHHKQWVINFQLGGKTTEPTCNIEEVKSTQR
jgi:hypothetical protein